MSLQTALFLVARGGTNYKVTGADIEAKLTGGDGLLVQRNGARFRYSYDGTLDEIQDSDLLLVWEDNQSKHVTGATFKTLFDDDFDYDQCMNDARAEYLRVMSLCESTYCCDVAYREYKIDIDECHEAAGLPPPSSYPAPRPCRA